MKINAVSFRPFYLYHFPTDMVRDFLRQAFHFPTGFTLGGAVFES